MAEYLTSYQTGLETLLANAGLSQGHSQANPDVVISEIRDVKITQISFFAGQNAKIKKQLAAFGISDIVPFSQLKAGKTAMAARVEMEKIWLIDHEAGDHIDVTALDKGLYPLDLSAARNVIRLSGARADDVLARLCAVDFRDKTRQFFATAIHHVGVHIHKHKDGYDIYIPRSFGESIVELIIDISRQYHVQMA